jgi:hypothetical protein
VQFVPEVLPDEIAQLMPGGMLVTEPAPSPAPITVTVKVGRLKVAVTFLSADIVSGHGLTVPLQ